jgi:hypothetical protein
MAVAALAGRKEPTQVPRSVRVDVHWGARKNRDVYRAEMERSIIADLLEQACFERVIEGRGADLVLEVQLNDFTTEQEYDTAQSLLPGQGEGHTLRSARARVNLDYWLRPEGNQEVEIAGGHIFREVAREPQYPVDPAEERALHDLTRDASHWVVRDLCGRRGRLVNKVAEALRAPPKESPSQNLR